MMSDPQRIVDFFLCLRNFYANKHSTAHVLPELCGDVVRAQYPGALRQLPREFPLVPEVSIREMTCKSAI